jgi:hypothetical protein
VALLASLTPKARAEFLIRLASALTVSGRALYHSGRPSDAIASDLYALNEIQHRITQYAYRALGTDEDQGWLKPVLAYIFEQDNSAVRKEAMDAWDRTRELWRAAT